MPLPLDRAGFQAAIAINTNDIRRLIAHAPKGCDLYEYLKEKIPNFLNNREQAKASFTHAYGLFIGTDGTDLEAQQNAIVPKSYKSLLHPHKEIIYLTESEALIAALKHGVAIKTPLDIWGESIALGFAFSVLVELFGDKLGPTSYQEAMCLVIACMVLYPLIYKLVNKIQGKSSFPAEQVAKEALMLGLLLLGAVSILSFDNIKDFWRQPLVGGAGVAGVKELIDLITGRAWTELTWTTGLTTLRRIISNQITFGGLISLLNLIGKYTTKWSPPASMALNTVIVIGYFNTVGRVIGILGSALQAYATLPGGDHEFQMNDYGELQQVVVDGAEQGDTEA